MNGQRLWLTLMSGEWVNFKTKKNNEKVKFR